MATSNWRHPGTISSQTRTGGSVSWTNPSNAAASDDSYATAAIASTGTHWLWCTNFGFDTSEVPSGATVVGIEVKWERKMSHGSANIEPVGATTYYKLIKSSAEHGTQKTVAGDLPASDTYETQGGAADMWGGTISDSDARASTTGIAIAHFSDTYATETISADDVQMRYHYTVASTGQHRMFLIFNTLSALVTQFASVAACAFRDLKQSLRCKSIYGHLACSV